jgi:hypothetical protein
MQVQAERLEREGRRGIENHPLNPSRASRLPSAVRDELVQDCQLHDLRGVALTGLYTVPDSSVRDRIASSSVPSLLIVGEREERFREYRLFAEEHMPYLAIAGFDAGHAVNAEVFREFNRTVEDFLRQFGDGASSIWAAEGRRDG